MISRILWWEGEDTLTPGIFYKLVVQATLLFSAETWVITSRVESTLGSFHHRVAYRLVGMWLRQDTMGIWV